MFNIQGSEVIIVLLLALVVLGPEKLPEAMRRFGQFYGDLKKMSTSFQQEFKAAVDEPMRELRDTANTLRDSADFRKLADGERAEKPRTAEMADAPLPPQDPTVEPTRDVPPEVADRDDAGVDTRNPASSDETSDATSGNSQPPTGATPTGPASADPDPAASTSSRPVVSQRAVDDEFGLREARPSLEPPAASEPTSPESSGEEPPA